MLNNVLVFGAGISGIGALKTLISNDINVTIYDEKKITLSKEDEAYFRNKKPFKFISKLEDDFYNKYNLIVISPGISLNNDKIQVAITHGVEVISEIELAQKFLKGRIIAITGTNGKTTTTTLLNEMMKTLPVKSSLGGNIGESLSYAAVCLDDENGYLVAEISSFQLESIRTFRPYIAAILNITPDHLERHGGFEGYIKAKGRVFENQTHDDFLILNHDDKILNVFRKQAKSKVLYFSTAEELAEGAFLKKDDLIIKYDGTEFFICKKSDMKIFGSHNIENALAASLCAFLIGVKVTDIRKTLISFSGVEHRLEYIKDIDGVPYYNDSKATNPESAIKALESFKDGHIILIAGGTDKKTDLKIFMQKVMDKVDYLILLGEAKNRFFKEAELAGIKNLIMVNTLADAVNTAYHLAKPKQIVLLSPACSSYDMFTSFEERGRCFKELVNAI